MGRGRWILAGAGLAAVLVAGVLVWRPWSSDPSVPPDPCEVAIGVAGWPPVSTPVEEVAGPDELRVLTDTAAPFGRPRLAVTGMTSPRLVGDGVLVQHSFPDEPVTALDARSGSLLWMVTQRGTGYGGQLFGDRIVLVQRAASGPATAVSVGLLDGEVRGCTTFDEDEPRSEYGSMVTVADRALALLRWPGRNSATLSLVDPTRAEPVWTSAVDVPRSAGVGHAAGDTLVFGSPWADVTGERGLSEADLRLYAFSTEDGSPSWQYAHQDFAHRVVGTDADDVVVYAGRLDEANDVVENRLAVLDARTGEPRWSAELPDSWPAAQFVGSATLIGDVVVAVEFDPERGTPAYLSGRDVATGRPLWRIDNRVANLNGAAVLGDVALFPGSTSQGLEVIDVRTGGSRTVFEGRSVTAVTADETSIGVEFLLRGDPVLVLYDRTG